MKSLHYKLGSGPEIIFYVIVMRGRIAEVVVMADQPDAVFDPMITRPFRFSKAGQRIRREQDKGFLDHRRVAGRRDPGKMNFQYSIIVQRTERPAVITPLDFGKDKITKGENDPGRRVEFRGINFGNFQFVVAVDRPRLNLGAGRPVTWSENLQSQGFFVDAVIPDQNRKAVDFRVIVRQQSAPYITFLSRRGNPIPVFLGPGDTFQVAGFGKDRYPVTFT